MHIVSMVVNAHAVILTQVASCALQVLQQLAFNFKLERPTSLDEYDENDVRKALGALMILEAYMKRTKKAEEILGRDNVLTSDWQR
jgi:hypothetical protein